MLDELPHDPESPAAVQPSHLPFPVVGIGASSGGLTALQRLLEHMPDQPGMAFVVVMHLSPTHESALDKILQKSTRMAVSQVTEAAPIEANKVYVIPPGKALAMNDGYLRLKEPERVDGRAVTIDMFFRSLAQAHRERSFCLVLSGAGCDGAQGLGRVKELGGVTFAQAPVDAEFDAMPRSAIATGLVDIVLPAAEMPAKLVELWENAQRIELPDPPEDLHTEETPASALLPARDALQSIMMLLRERTGNDFTQYKRTTVLRRIERRMQVNAVATLPAYLDFLETDADETHELLQDMLIGVTQFFRDRDAFESLERELAVLHASREPREPLRAWVAGCATGEEAYSLTMLLCGQFDNGSANAPSIQVFASDIDQRAINRARNGVYPESIVTDVPPSMLRRHFTKEASGYRISKNVQDKVTFSTHNVLRDPPFTRLDVISCRNLMIYLDRSAQLQMLQTFHFALKPNGLLMLGNAESADAAEDLFTVVDKRQRIYRAHPIAGPRLVDVPRMMINPPPPVMPVGTTPRAPRAPIEELHRRLCEQFAAPSVLINAEHSIVHVDDRAARLLRHVGGTPSTKLLTLVQPELRPALRAALQRAAEGGISVEAPRVSLQRKNGMRHMHMTVRPASLSESEVPTGHLLVTFDELDATLEPSADGHPAGPDPVVEALEAELQRAQAELDDRAAQSLTTAEDLRASNEELQAVNEELRSTTEELQSVNEELITVNNELRAGLDETAKLNDDLRNLIASTDLAIVFLDRDLRVKRFTPRAAQLFNLIDGDVGRPLLDITHRLDYATLATDLVQTLESLQHIEREVSSLGGRRYLVRLVPYRTAEDRIDGVVLNFIDITARHAAELQLRATERLMHLVAQSMHDYAIITTDISGHITGWTEGAERMFGYTSDEMMGKTLDIIYTTEDRAAGAPRAELREAASTGRSENERWHVRKDGSTFYSSGITTKLQDETVQGFAKIARDMTYNKVVETHRREQFEAEKASRARLEEANILKDEFLAVMSHELKNPLNLIQLNAELLLRTPEGRSSPPVLRAAETIRRAVTSQVQIIDDLLDLSRLNTGKLHLSKGRTDLRSVVERIVEAVQVDAHAKGLTLSTQVADMQLLDADVVRIEQVVWNLVNNALKFTPRGGSVLVSTAVDGDEARFSVRDTGVGLDAQSVEEVFEMFRQSDRGAAREKGGLGVGLALVKRLVELHGGRVQASSPGPHKGSTFTVWLPFRHKEAADSEPSGLPLDLDGLRILLVDDEEESLETFGQLVEMSGAEVTLAGSGAAALEHVATRQFDVVISDIAMPGMDGLALVDRLRDLPQTRTTVCIAVTGRATVSDRTRAIRAGFDAQLGKPVDIVQLVDVIQRLLQEREDTEPGELN